ncbi:hypothetical protein CAPTEDRAFT_48304, partial [Capitella teleta]
DDRLVTGSADSTIRVWGLHDGRCQSVMKGHLRGVWSLCFFTTNLLISGSYDSTMRVRDAQVSSSVQTYSGHSETINCVHCDRRRIISASYDFRVKIWD